MNQFKVLRTGIIVYENTKKNSTRIEILTPKDVRVSQKWYNKLLSRI